jgi:hypothetical protein
MDLGVMGWKDAALIAIVVVAAYLGYALLRLSRLRGRGEAGGAFAEQQFVKTMEAELSTLRQELAAVRDEVERLKAARHVAPQYADAMALAQRGADAHTIAERCGISLGEAELVRALGKKSP